MRPDWDRYFLQLCDLVATRSTCDRKHVGAILVKDNRILSTGYNGSLRGLPHCDDVGHDMIDGHCVRTVHGEANAIATAASQGISLEGSTLYCNVYPCWSCFKLIISAGITEVVYQGIYNPDPRIDDALGRLKNFKIRKVEHI